VHFLWKNDFFEILHAEQVLLAATIRGFCVPFMLVE